MISKLPVIKKVFRFTHKTLLPSVSPELTLAMRHLRTFGYWPNLHQPKTFNEKIHWKKLHDRREVVALTSDKFAVRDYVRSKGLENMLIPLLWHGTDPKAIPFEQLPDSFVVKPNHLSSAVVIIRGKRTADIGSIVTQAEKWMKVEHYPKYLEWAYKNMKPMILIEEFKSDANDEGCLDYKFYCYHGEPKFCHVDMDRFNDHRRNMYDINWRLLPVKYNYDNGPHVQRPDNLDTMVHICRKLSQDFDFVRVDLYSAHDGIFFSELTHYPAAGFGMFNPPEFDLEMGSYWNVGA